MQPKLKVSEDTQEKTILLKGLLIWVGVSLHICQQVFVTKTPIAYIKEINLQSLISTSVSLHICH